MRTTRMSRSGAALVACAALAVLTACGGTPDESGTGASPSATAGQTDGAPDGPGGDATPSATPSGTPSEAPSEAPTDAPTGEPTDPPGEAAPYLDGYQPAWFEGTQWSCGMPAADLETVSEDYTLTIAGDVTDVAGGEPSHSGDRYLPVVLTGPEGRVHVSPPATVWTQGDVVVHLPALADSGPVEAAGGERLDAVLGILSHCLPGDTADGMTRYETELPDGEYEVRAFVEIDPVRTPRQLVLSDPVDVAVTPDGTVQR